MYRHYKHLIVVTAVGGAFEMFDFAVFIHFSSYLAEVFFPEASGFHGVMPVLLIFLVSYLARPVGGILFSHFGDRVGRKKLFIASLICMTGATLGIALLPGWHSIGYFAPVLLLLLRVVQGLSVGGELPAAFIFLAEHVDKAHRGSVCAKLAAAFECGLIMGASIGALLTWLLTTEQMLAWGWRVPFIIGCLLGIVGYQIRKHTAETPIFLQMLHTVGRQRVPLLGLMSRYKKLVFLTICMTAVGGSMSAIRLFLPAYLSNSGFFSSNISQAYGLTAFFSLICALMCYLLGQFSDWWGRKNLVVTGTSLLIFISFVTIYLLDYDVIVGRWFFILVLPIAHSFVICAYCLCHS